MASTFFVVQAIYYRYVLCLPLARQLEAQHEWNITLWFNINTLNFTQGENYFLEKIEFDSYYSRKIAYNRIIGAFVAL